jgi:SAM-dependent methyltransferase
MTDLAGEQFWDSFWSHQHGRRYGGLSYHQHRMRQLFAPYVRSGARVCEVGCGGSAWLPQLARAGAAVWGIDYSPRGLELAEANLARAGVKGTLIEGDVRDPDALPAECFDVVFSVGVIEHFDDPAAVLRVVSRSLRPNGVLITLVPNLAGWWGALQRKIDPAVLAVHTIYTPTQLDAVHRDAGLVAREQARCFGGFCPLAVSYTRLLRRAANPVKSSFIRAVWLLQQTTAWTLAVLGAADRASYSGTIAGVYVRDAVDGGLRTNPAKG